MTLQLDFVPPLREALICLVQSPAGDAQDHLFGALVRREGMRFELIRPFLDDQAALLTDSRTITALERMLDLPIRVLEPDNSLFLGMETMLAHREGRKYFHLKGQKSSLGPGFAQPQGPPPQLRDDAGSSELDHNVVRPKPLLLALNPHIELPQ